MSPDILNKLRNRQPITILKPYMDYGKCFFKIQLNKKSDGICWERWVSKDRSNWIQLNSCLSLKDINNILYK